MDKGGRWTISHYPDVLFFTSFFYAEKKDQATCAFASLHPQPYLAAIVYQQIQHWSSTDRSYLGVGADQKNYGLWTYCDWREDSLENSTHLLHVSYPKDSRCSLQTQLRWIFRLMFHDASAASNPPELRLQTTRVQLCTASLKKFPEENKFWLTSFLATACLTQDSNRLDQFLPKENPS